MARRRERRPREDYRHWIPRKIYASGFVLPFGDRRRPQLRLAATAAMKREADFEEAQQERGRENINQTVPSEDRILPS